MRRPFDLAAFSEETLVCGLTFAADIAFCGQGHVSGHLYADTRAQKKKKIQFNNRVNRLINFHRYNICFSSLDGKEFTNVFVHF